MPKKALDQYANMAALVMTEPAANTQKTTKFAFPFSIMDKMALVICRLEYDFANLTTCLTGTADRMFLGIIASGSVADPGNPADPLVIDAMRVTRHDLGVAANGTYTVQPYVKDYTMLPGGGLLVAPNPLYGLIQGSGAGAAGLGTIRLYYTYIELATDEYWQLVESRRIISD